MRFIHLLLSSDAEVILIGVECARIVHVRFLNVEYIDCSRLVRLMGKTDTNVLAWRGEQG